MLYPPPAVKPYETALLAGMLIVQLTVAEVAVTVAVGWLIISTGVTESVTEDDFVASWALVAVTVTVLPLVGAVRTPEGVMLPPLTVHTSPEEYPPVPFTDAAHVRLLPCAIVLAGQDAVTLVMVFGASVSVKLPLLVGSPTDVAVMMALPLAGSVAGAV